MSEPVISAYERVLIPLQTPATKVFLYAVHFEDGNALQLGFGMETRSGLNIAHLPGPWVHELHTGLVSDWLRKRGSVVLNADKPPRIHPFSSTMERDLPVFLKTVTEMPLTAGRFMPLINTPTLFREDMIKFADAIDRAHIAAWGHPMDWDCHFCDLADGRFVWMAYDDDLGKIRIGMGFYDETNTRMFGSHTYAVGRRDAAGFVAYHYLYLDAPLQFMGLPPRWPHEIDVFLTGTAKQKFVSALLGLADEVWPGEVGT